VPTANAFVFPRDLHGLGNGLHGLGPIDCSILFALWLMSVQHEPFVTNKRSAISKVSLWLYIAEVTTAKGMFLLQRACP
jgi:hypothetical protein